MLILLLRSRFREGQTCEQITDTYELLTIDLYNSLSIHLGQAGTNAIVKRALKLATPQNPLLKKIKISSTGLDLTELHAYASSPTCDEQAVMHAVLHLAEQVFQVLDDLVGNALNEHVFADISRHHSNSH